MRRVRTFIIGRPRPLPRQRRADHLYTLNCEEPVFKVAQRLDDSDDESACASAAKAMVFTSPKRVYCLTKLVE